MTTKRLPDSLKEASEFILSNITNDTFIPLFTKSGSTEVMKKIKANVLNNGGGGGSSTPAAQPDRVIIIDSSLENNIEGKAYKTFAEAKTYMESINDTYFQVELPAGDFSEPIVIGGNWFIHGNETNLIGLLDTENFVGLTDLDSMTYSANISNCTISGGFKRYENADPYNPSFPIYSLSDCKILNTGTKIPTQEYDLTFILNYGGYVDADGSLDLAFECFDTIIKRFAVGIAVMHGCTAESFTAMVVYAINCTFSDLNVVKLMNSNAEPTGWLTISQKLIAIGCTTNTNLKCLGDVIMLRNGSYQFNKIAISSSNYYMINVFYVQNSNLWRGKIVDASNVDDGIDSTSTIQCENSIIDYHYSGGMIYSLGTINISLKNSVLNSVRGYHSVTADANSQVNLSNTIAILNAACNTSVYGSSSPTTNNKPPRYQFANNSTGSDMSTTDEGQNYIGIIKDPTAIKSSQPTNNDYMWIFRKAYE